ncbi:MAG TPA: hypothetical protein PKV71_12990, partial [Calditrichia bacterium]|nr:hypothetical protein [Calditrichia bacterium]
FFKDAREDNRPQRLRGIAESPTALEKRCGASPGLIYQELIDTPHTFGVAFLASNGELHTHFIHRELCSFPVSGGSGVILQRHSAPRLLDLTQNLLDKLGYNGWGLMEFKWCSRRKDFVFMELNAKFWESAAFAFLNQPAFLKHLLGINYPGQAIDKAVYLKRFFLLPIKTQLAMLGKLPGCRLLGTEHLKSYVAGHLLPERLKTGVKQLSGLAKNLVGQG